MPQHGTREQNESFYQRHRRALWISGAVLLSLLVITGLVAVAIFTGPILGGVAIAALVAKFGAPIAMAISVAVAVAAVASVVGIALGIRGLWKTAKSRYSAYKQKWQDKKALLDKPADNLGLKPDLAAKVLVDAVKTSTSTIIKISRKKWSLAALEPLASRLANVSYQWVRNQLMRNTIGERFQRALFKSTPIAKERADISRVLAITSAQAPAAQQKNDRYQFQGSVLTTDMKAMTKKKDRVNINSISELLQLFSNEEGVDHIQTICVNMDLTSSPLRNMLVQLLNYYYVNNLILEGPASAAEPLLTPELSAKNFSITHYQPYPNVDDTSYQQAFLTRNHIFRQIIEEGANAEKLNITERMLLINAIEQLTDKYNNVPTIKVRLENLLKDLKLTVALTWVTSLPDKPARKPAPIIPVPQEKNSAAPIPASVNKMDNVNPNNEKAARKTAATQAKPDWYGVLLLKNTAEKSEIRKAYLDLSKKWHPDKNNDPEAIEQFKWILEAYVRLSEPSIPADQKLTLDDLEARVDRLEQSTKTLESNQIQQRATLDRQGATLDRQGATLDRQGATLDRLASSQDARIAKVAEMENQLTEMHTAVEKRIRKTAATQAKPDWYGVLLLKSPAEKSEIRKAYLDLSKKWHPDKNSDPEAIEQFKWISEAYVRLTDPSIPADQKLTLEELEARVDKLERSTKALESNQIQQRAALEKNGAALEKNGAALEKNGAALAELKETGASERATLQNQGARLDRIAETQSEQMATLAEMKSAVEKHIRKTAAAPSPTFARGDHVACPDRTSSPS